MDRAAIEAAVSNAIVDLFGIDRAKVTPQASFEELELTSIDAIDLLVELQQATGKKIPPANLKELRTVGDIAALIEAEFSKGQPAALA